MNMLALRRANVTRQKEWDNSDTKADLAFWGVELAGEVGEACNIIKKLERERLGMRGSRATVQDLAEELADVIICVDLVALWIGVIADPKEIPIATKNKALTMLGNEMAAASGMVNHLIANNMMPTLTSMLCILVNRVELIAQSQKISLDVVVKAKFNSTSEKYNLQTRMQ